ncbi:MAG TPA: cyclic nucleotide-binding domain-containing protein [Pseudomonadota bacterium]|nr:cyclic nucleotide-binding domain-containing protein [Pseudomonadota bacterium]
MPLRVSNQRERVVQVAFMSVYVFLIFFGLISDKIDSVYFKSTRIFWTMGLPLAPFFMVIFGYYVWRRLCPLSLFAKVGSLIPRTKQRRIPPWFERWGYMVIFGGMYLSLGIRHLFTNGSGVWLSAFLLGIGLCAFVVGAIFTGKTWCNFLCPVAIIEKTYLEPTGMGRGVKADNSQCKRCTACKKHCPDIDVEVGYWKDKDLLSRRMSAYGWPGLVFAFYWVYWTYKGTWDYYFSGVWTREPNEWKSIFGPGFFFAPWVPKICATYLALLAPTLLSWVIFFAIEKLLTKRYGQERAVHWTLSLAAFAAFNLFYIFAGQPTWRKIPGGSQLASFIAVALSTLFLVRRFPRREDESVQEKFAKRFIARWSWKDEKPPEDLREAFYVIKHKEQEKEVGLRVYADTIRELMSEGVLTRAELRIIEQVRTQFNISDQDHEKVLQQLQISDRQLFDPNVAVSAEERLQEQGYRLALRTQLLRGASKRDIDNLRRDYNIPLENHNRIVEEITGSAGGHVQQVHDLLARIEDLRAVYRVLCGFVMGPALEFLSLVLLKRQDRLVDHVLDVLSLMGLGDLIRHNRGRLFDQDKVTRATAIDALRLSGEPELMDRFLPILEERVPSYDSRSVPTEMDQERVLDALASEHDPFVRAGAMLASALPGDTPSPLSIERLLSGMNDEDALVREAAIQALPTGWGMAAGNLLGDADRSVRDAAQAALARRVGGAAGPGAPAGLPVGPPQPTTGPAEQRLHSIGKGPAALPLPSSSEGALAGPPQLMILPSPPVPPQAAEHSSPTAMSSISREDGFGSAQADTMVTGRFAVPRLPTNLGPVCTNLERILFLHCVPLFVDFEPEDLLVLARASEERSYTEGTVLFNQGDHGDEVFVIISGRVEVMIAGDAERAINVIGPGDCLGEMSVIDGSPRSATALIVGVGTRALAIRGETFRRFVEERSHVSGKIIGVLANRLRQYVERSARPLVSAKTAQPQAQAS